MTKTQAIEIVRFIADHYDYVSQDDWFDFCEMVMDAIVRDANRGGFAKSLVEMFPYFFETNEN